MYFFDFLDVFIEWRRIAGWIDDKGIQKIKLTYGQSDGSTVDGYNTDGSGVFETKLPDGSITISHIDANGKVNSQSKK